MDVVLSIVRRSGISDLFLFACVAFFIAKLVLSQDWGTREDLKNLRASTSIAFHGFGWLMLLACLFSLPQCAEIREKHQPKAESVAGGASHVDKGNAEEIQAQSKPSQPAK